MGTHSFILKHRGAHCFNERFQERTLITEFVPFCRECGKEVQENWITCPYCSTTIGSLPDSNLQKTPATNVQKSIVKVDTPSVVVQDSIVKVEGANNASYHNPTIQSEQNIDYVESSKYSPNIWAFIFIGVIISVIGDDGIFSGGCVFGFPIILFAVAYKLHFTSRHKYRCGACDKVNYISTAVGLVQMTTSGHQSITSINPAVGVTTSGKLGVGGITTTSQIPIEIGSVVWTDKCNHCDKPNRWINEENIRRWTEPSSNQFSFEIVTKSGPK